MDRIKRFIESTFSKDVRANFTINGSPGSYVDFPENLNPEIKKILSGQGITKLYEHQSEAFRSIENNRHTLVVSRTASGKTLSFFLPIINEYLHADQPFYGACFFIRQRRSHGTRKRHSAS